MNPNCRKFMSLFLVFSLLTINCAYLNRVEEKRERKSRKGARLVIEKMDGQQITGELIAVKKKTLLLIDSKAEIDISIDVRKIKFIKVRRKSKVLKGMGIGLSVGGVSGMLIGATKNIDGDDEKIPFFLKIIFPFLFFIPNPERARNSVSGFLIGGGAGLLAGTILGVVAEKNSHIQIEGMSDLKIQETLDKLRKKARVRDYK
jgi:hypothetical protein